MNYSKQKEMEEDENEQQKTMRNDDSGGFFGWKLMAICTY